MSGYTIEVLDNLLEKLRDKIEYYKQQMENENISSKEYNRLLGKYEQYIVDYCMILDQRMNLYEKNIYNNSST